VPASLREALQAGDAGGPSLRVAGFEDEDDDEDEGRTETSPIATHSKQTKITAMTKRSTNPKVDANLTKDGRWLEEIEKLRKIFLDCQLTEELKWGKPCYSFENKNVVIIMRLKESCTLLFFKGGLLKDPHGILIRPTEHTEAGRQMRFTSVREIVKMAPILKAYIHEAIEVEKAGLEVEVKKPAELRIPEEFQNKLDAMPALKRAFETLTPGRQRGYIFYFSGAKQSKTRESRVEKYMQQILDGKGLDDL
jgi:uncharacterized protein YdeI (YjbR/CyaY-like superfamily)